MKCKDCYKEGYPHRCYTDDAECVLQQWTAKQFDWQSFRAEAAKDILCAMINKENGIIYDGELINNYKRFLEIAIIIADALTIKLKEKEA